MLLSKANRRRFNRRSDDFISWKLWVAGKTLLLFADDPDTRLALRFHAYRFVSSGTVGMAPVPWACGL